MAACWEEGVCELLLTQAPSRAAGRAWGTGGGGPNALAESVSAPSKASIRLAAAKIRERRRFRRAASRTARLLGAAWTWREAPGLGAAWRDPRSERIGSPPKCRLRGGAMTPGFRREGDLRTI